MPKNTKNDKLEGLSGQILLLGRKLVIQGLHMVSGTRCPALLLF